MDDPADDDSGVGTAEADASVTTVRRPATDNPATSAPALPSAVVASDDRESGESQDQVSSAVSEVAIELPERHREAASVSGTIAANFQRRGRPTPTQLAARHSVRPSQEDIRAETGAPIEAESASDPIPSTDDVSSINWAPKPASPLVISPIETRYRRESTDPEPHADLNASDHYTYGARPTAEQAVAFGAATGDVAPAISLPPSPLSEVSPTSIDFAVMADGTAIPVRVATTAQPTRDAFDTSALKADAGFRSTDAPAPVESRKSVPYAEIARRAIKWAAIAVVGWVTFIVALIGIYRFVDPPFSALMLQRELFGEAVTHQWTDLQDISPNIVRAVIMSEDARFCEHSGVDFDALEKALAQAGNGSPRGASTISMQVVKNLFLWPSKSIVRKAVEFPLTFVLELLWPKRRIMEVYLNIAEWGPGIFGIGKASEFHFRKSASGLTEREAARLAVALPNPLVRNAGRPGAGTLRLAQYIQFRMRAVSPNQIACVIRTVRR